MAPAACRRPRKAARARLEAGRRAGGGRCRSLTCSAIRCRWARSGQRMPRAAECMRGSRERRARRAPQAHLRQPNLVLFDEALEFLAAPLVAWRVPAPYRSDCLSVPAHPESSAEEQAPSGADSPIAYDPWVQCGLRTGSVTAGPRPASTSPGPPVLALPGGAGAVQQRAREVERAQVDVSPGNLALLRVDRRIQRSHALVVHETDEPFTFHNRCIAARMDEDVIREGVRRHCPADLIEAVARVVRV
ncbi:MAG: hypothetical protein MZW92_60775 [Comamonadaceae bacterium]|nr:hypothetical protein [Comamonadaceae bacterium]